MKVFCKLFFVCLIAVPIASCGFRAGSSVLNSSEGVITKMSIPVFTNKTRRPGVETVITEAFTYEFKNTVEIVADDSPEAEAKMVGTVLDYDIEPTSVDANNIATAYRLLISFNVKIVTPDGKVLWDDTITDYEDFEVDRSDNSSRIIHTKDREWEVLKKMVRDRARIFKEFAVENFK